MEHSILERGNTSRKGLNSNIAFGRIVSVDVTNHLCAVSTFMGSGQMDDNFIPACQWINGDTHPDGDESGTIPRPGSYGLVFYVDGEPFIFGFWRPLNDTGSAAGNSEPLNQGDRILKTIGGNLIILRAHGEIQIQATYTCRTIYFPDSNIINTLCRNYEFACDGGSINWHNYDANNDTYFIQEFRDNIARTNVVIEERGLIEDGSPIISRTTIGAGTSDNFADSPVYQQIIQNTGEIDTFINPPGGNGYHANITPDGTGTFEFGFGVTITIGSDGQIDIKTTGPVNVQAGGEVNVQAGGAATIQADTITLQGGEGEALGVLLADYTLSDFTGLPLAPSSDTVSATT